jgi:hypothetical protein
VLQLILDDAGGNLLSPTRPEQVSWRAELRTRKGQLSPVVCGMLVVLQEVGLRVDQEWHAGSGRRRRDAGGPHGHVGIHDDP